MVHFGFCKTDTRKESAGVLSQAEVVKVLSKARYAPLPERTLQQLRWYGSHHRHRQWLFHFFPAGRGARLVRKRCLKYLAPYIFRVALNNQRLVKVAEGQVTFRYTPSGGKKSKLCTLPAEAFIRRFLQHVLPKWLIAVSLLERAA